MVVEHSDADIAIAPQGGSHRKFRVFALQNQVTVTVQNTRNELVVRTGQTNLQPVDRGSQTERWLASVDSVDGNCARHTTAWTNSTPSK